ncbi:two-component system, sensor histidine kinase [Lapidilactobacillus concavus DSM 17758]|uniref:histidine kinase n=1 Tax=Lapidilactobacillus concavus DSM 17758 TaxID=1423735 RepID=A0A0R1W576_9LACO|nr:HAMP domain-containing sensor histidine kinase [Lapidilactobacillus concavus]KRM10595.1 two-component system, sensor histidine kinase [Lapidilactobacillus concavus DSM 17758]GEL12584.1 signal transduction histidine kinase [Lapidilactobacillus concavus]
MKLIYQQMLGFFLVIFTTLLIVSAAVINYNNRQAYETTWQQLEGYADKFGELFTRTDPQTGTYQAMSSDFLNEVRFVLSNDQVYYAIFNEGNEQIYPTAGVSAGNLQLDAKTWKQLKAGKIIHSQTNRSQSQGPKIGGGELAYVVYPWFNQDKKFVGAMYIGSRVTRIKSTLREMKNNLLVGLAASLLVALAVSFVLARFYVRRINRLRQATRTVASGNFDVELVSNGRDEIDDLASDFNSMVSSLDESQKEIARQEQRRREFMANAAHEMRTPLTTINGILEGLEYDAIPEEAKDKSFKLMRKETQRLIRLVNENLDYEKIRSNQTVLNKREFNGTEAVGNIVEQLTQKAMAAGDELVLATSDPVKVFADYDRFIQVIFNVTQNAIQFTENGRVTLALKQLENGAEITISDNGIGMSDDQLKNIWERYYKADPSRKNTKYGESGLGLAIVHSLIEQHHGHIEVTSKLNHGSTFTIFFPNQTIAKTTITETTSKQQRGRQKHKEPKNKTEK